MNTGTSRQAGFSMVEVLITMFVIAIALLGSAILQAYALKVNQGGQFRAQAVILGMDFLERIEANNQAAVLGAYAATLPSTSTAPDCNLNLCTPQQMAAYDLEQFQQALARQLPDTSATITVAGAGPYTYTVQINWRERSFRSKATRSASAAETETFSYTVSRTIHDRSVTI